MISGCDIGMVLERYCWRIIIILNSNTAIQLDVLALPDGVDHAYLEQPFNDLIIKVNIFGIQDRALLRILTDFDHFRHILLDIWDESLSEFV